MRDLQEVLSLLGREGRFVLTTHQHPDGDGLGSLLALGSALRQKGKTVMMILNEDVPNAYSFLEGAREVRSSLDPEFRPSHLIALDCGDRERMAIPPDLSRDLPVINIDHHLSNNFYGQLNLVDPDAAATGEIIHRLLTEGGYRIDAQIATAIYVAIATDTGFFRYTNASKGAFSLAAGLVQEFDLDPGRIAEVVHEQKSLNAVKLLGLVLDSLRVAIDGRVAWMFLSQEMMAEYPVELEETEGFINYARSIIGVEVALFFKEARRGEVRISWRSGPTVDVSQLAAGFGGGGHARAAGCTIHGELNQAIDQVLAVLARRLEVATV